MTRSTWADPSATWADPVEPWADEGVTDLGFACEWSPSTNPGDPPVWVDITARVRSGRVSRGRQSEFDRTSAGQMSLTLDNRDRTFDPEHNPNARPNKRIRVTVGTGTDLRHVFDGWIDSMPQLYSSAVDAVVSLTATDAFKLLAKFKLDEIYGEAVLADSPYAYWRLADDLPIATSATDSSGNGYDGDWKGTPSATGSLIADGLGAVSLDGEADGVVISTGTLPSTPLSIEAWVKTGKYGTNLSLIAGQTHQIGGTNPQFIRDFVLFMDNDTGVANFTARIVGESNITVTGTTVLRDTGPHHVVGTIDTDRKLRLYVDGVQEGGTSAAATGTSLDSSGRLRIGRPPTNNETGAGDTYKCFKGDICEVAVYDRALSAARVLAHYNAGSAPWSGDSTGDRVDRVLNLIGWPSGDRSIEAGASTLGAAANIEGVTALDHLLAVEQTEQGRFFISGAGDATFYGRNHETSLTVQASFDDGENDGLEFDYSDANITNDMTVTRAGGLPQRAVDQTSIDAYWRHSDDMSGLLYATDSEALAMAQWRVANYAEPVMRPTNLRFKPLINLSNVYPKVLMRELGDRIEVTKTTPAGGSVVVDAVIEGIEHQFAGGMDWRTSWNLSPIVSGQFGPGGGGGGGFTYVKLNDATLGQLDNNRLGF